MIVKNTEKSETQKIKNESGIEKYILIVRPNKEIIAQGLSKSATINTPNDSIVWIADSQEEIDQKIIDENYITGL